MHFFSQQIQYQALLLFKQRQNFSIEVMVMRHVRRVLGVTTKNNIRKETIKERLENNVVNKIRGEHQMNWIGNFV